MTFEQEFEQELEKCPAIAILRGVTPSEILSVAGAIADAGISLIEIPLNSPAPVESIRLAANAFHSRGRVLVGAGTVLSAEDVRAVAEAGGKYIISPDTFPEVIAETKKLGLVSIPGFLTPTEGFKAMRAGADYLKLFPAGRFGASYIGDVKAVIRKPILAVGGITLENAPQFLKAASGIGIGGAIYKPGKTLPEIAADAKKFAALAK